MSRAAAALAAVLLLSGLAASPLRAATSAAIETLAARPLAPSFSGAEQTASVQMQGRESLAAALVRSGLPASEATRAAAALADGFDTQAPHPGLALLVSSARAGGATVLTRLTFSPSAETRLGLTREADGVLHLLRVDAPVFLAPSLTNGVVHGSLFQSITAAGVDAEMAEKIVRLFGRRIDLAREVADGDRFRLVFDQRRRGAAGALGRGELLYADLTTAAGVARLYRYQGPGAAAPEWIDGDGDPRRAGLLRTPLDAMRVTSAFGMRLHPLLGFTRMHQGVDFGAPTGTPVFAAADGVVEEARWDGGYGRWLKIRHGADLETGYGHLSAWAVAPGTAVRQGQIVAYVGATGLATGPHLHFEVFRGGVRIDPARAPSLRRAPRDVATDPAFRARKAGIDAVVASLSAQCAEPGLFPNAPAPRCIG